MPDMMLFEAYQPVVEAVREENGNLYFEGVALVDNLLSHNGYFYSAEFNDLCMANTNAWMDEGHPVTMYTRHSKATGDWMGAGEDIPIGRVAEPLYREGNTIRYKGMIAATSTGRDMQTLVREGIVKPTSIRTYTFTAKPATMEGEEVMWLTDGRVEGIDFCERPGIEGAGVKRIFEEAPPYAEPQGKEANIMDWDTLNYEEVVEHRRDLFERFTTEHIGSLLSERDALKGQVEELANRPPAPADTSALEAEVASLKRDLAIERAAHGDVSALIAQRLRGEDVPEDALAERAGALRLAMLNDAVAETGGGDGKAAVEDVEEDAPDASGLTEHLSTELEDVDVDELLRNSMR